MLDTDHIWISKKNPAPLEALRTHPPSKVRASSISAAELHYGAAKSAHSNAVEAYGAVRAGLEKRGAHIGLLDTLIAAHVPSLGWTLLTHNIREFKRIPTLAVEVWLA